MTEQRYRCPRCGSASGETFWEEGTISAWRSVDEFLRPARQGKPDRDVVSWEDFDSYELYGCTCGWHGKRGDLARVGNDDEPLPDVDPNQGSLL